MGPYEVLDLIGAGGMGEVYSALDTRLDRRVAIKVLPAEISADPDRRTRFEREARMVATLEHPHICTLYDVGSHEASLFLVMEHLSGETLAERLRRGPLPIDQTLTVATQIAEALAAAHSQHVVHRDLKPANVMLTKSGAKLLDFGIAKLKSPDAARAPSAVTTLLTLDPVTAAGTLVGTVPYMAPEQLEGREADARSDIFSFGAVVYEMLTGARAFQGDTQASLIAAILGSAASPPQHLRDGIPPALDRLVLTCLARDPADRWQSARDIVLHLTSLQTVAARSAVIRRVNPWALAAGFVLCAVVSALAVDLWWRNTVRVPEGPLKRLSLTLPAGTQLALNTSPAAGASLAISPDGLTVAFVATGSSVGSLHVRSLESGLVKALAGTEGAMSPFFSPDGRWIGFFTRVELKRVSIDDGTVVGICPTPPVTRGGVWARDGTIYFSPSFSSGLQTHRAWPWNC